VFAVSGAPDRFAQDFRKHIMPRLEARLPDTALSVLNEEQSYGDAFSALWWFSWFRGASFLADDVLSDLDEWIHKKLLAEIDRLEPQVEQQIKEWQQSPRDPSFDVWAAYKSLRHAELSHAE
jgi:hypothetical protein